jgi:parallel beta-helix repeat protein
MKLKRTSRLIFFIFLLVFLIINALPLKTLGQQNFRVQNLSTDEEYETIQEAINAANVGDTLYVRNGTYYEHVVVNKTISLVGENKSNTIIDGGGSGNVIVVTANDVNIRGFTIQNSGHVITSKSDVSLYRSSGSKISDNIIRNSLYGISVYYSHGNSVLNNTISDNPCGMSLTSATNNMVSDNDFLHNNNGILLSYSTHNTFSANNVSLNTVYAFSLSACTDNVFASNRVSNNTCGFRLMASTDNRFSGNNVLKNKQGFSLSASRCNTFSGNNVSLNTLCGVWLGTSSDNVFLNNYLVNNWNNFHLTTSDSNIIYHNSFINTQANTTQLPICIESENFWDNGVEGNYWSNLTGFDKNKDGISDTAYIIDEKNKDNYPLLATSTQFSVMVENKIYTINVVSSFTISNFEYFYYSANGTAAVKFEVTDDVGGNGFCRICVPHSVIEPPYAVIVDHNASLYTSIVRSNKTHSWLYFTYHPENGSAVISLLSTEQFAWYQLWFWTTIGLTVVVIILVSLVIKYRRVCSEQEKIIAAYELELKMNARKHLDATHALFEADVKRRKVKINKFETKYNVRIRPRNNFEDVIRRLRFKKKEEEKAAS